MRKVSDSYTKYFNKKYSRTGPLLTGPFKSVIIESDEQMLHLSRYIHLNPVVSLIAEDLSNYYWSSYLNYIGQKKDIIINPEYLLGFFKNKGVFELFVMDQADYGKSLEALKHHLID